MAKLSLWLPPFSPDYSGAAAVLFDLHTVTAMHDASGCTGNYTGYDDPRWYGSKSGIFCSGLRQIDAVLGDDEKLMKKMEAAAADLKPDLLALVGSPVPMVIGADLRGVATELEARTGIAAIGLDTTGTAYYDKGAFMAAKALMDRFTYPQDRQKNRVNILGALPMDFGYGENIRDLKERLGAIGHDIGLCLAMDYCLEDLKEAASAGINLAVSRFGFLTALYMEKRFGIPYLCGFPVGGRGMERWLEAFRRVSDTGISEILLGRTGETGNTGNAGAAGNVGNAGETGHLDHVCPGVQVLVIGEQVMCNSIRNALWEDLGIGTVTIGCIFGREEALSCPGDLDLSDEKVIKEAVNRPDYQMIIADPFFKMLLPDNDGRQFLPLSQYAVSSKLGEKDSACVVGDKFNEWFKRRTT